MAMGTVNLYSIMPHKKTLVRARFTRMKTIGTTT